MGKLLHNGMAWETSLQGGSIFATVSGKGRGLNQEGPAGSGELETRKM